MRTRITKRLVEGLEAKAKDILLWDDKLTGFGVRVRPSGAKYYLVQYRDKTTRKQRWYSIGKHGAPWTTHKARQEAETILYQAKAKNERDPAEERDTLKVAPTIARLGEKFMREHVALHCKSTTQGEYQRALDLFINPAMGNVLVDKLTVNRVRQLHADHAKIPYQANRTRGVLHKMMEFAIDTGLRADGTNPVTRVKPYKEKKRERYLTDDELKRLGESLDRRGNTDGTLPSPIACIRLLALTGARLREILTAKWSYVDWKRNALRLPDSKANKPKWVYLCPEAIAVLQRIPRIRGNPYIIAGTKQGQHFIGMQKAWRRIKADAELDDVRLHDLRHTFASVGVNRNHSLPMLGKALGHSNSSTTERYAHLADDPVRQASADIGSAIANALGGD